MKTFAIAPPRMHNLRNQTIYQYADDTTTDSRYTFNNLGYRSDIEFEICDGAIVVLGNTLTFGLGLDIKDTFVGILSTAANVPVYNFSWGRHAHENCEQLELLKNILHLINPKLVIFQINDLNRIRIDNHISFDNSIESMKNKFDTFYTELKTILHGKIPHVLLHWDYENHGIDVPDCLIRNRYHIDSVDFYTNGKHMPVMGKKSHKLIAVKILKHLKDNGLL